MSQQLTAASLKSFFDANPSKYKTNNLALVNPQDGYSPTWELWNLMRHLVGTQPNPTPAQQILKPFTAAQIMGQVASANRAKAMQCPGIVGIYQSITDQDRTAIANWAQLCVDDGIISQTEQAAIMGVIEATEDDPNWQATVDGPCDLVSQFGVANIDDMSVIEVIKEALGRTE